TSHLIGLEVTVRIARTSASACCGLARASITTTPESLTTNPALGRPSEPRPVSPSAAYTPAASRRRVGGGGAVAEKAGARTASTVQDSRRRPNTGQAGMSVPGTQPG